MKARTGASNLTDVGESLAALTVDEVWGLPSDRLFPELRLNFLQDLISKMARAATKEEFAAAFDNRLGEIVL